MRRCWVVFVAAMMMAAPVDAQSLYLTEGQQAVEGGVAWSVGPSSTGVEVLASTNVTSRIDVGLMFARYTYTFDDGSKSTFNEYAPFVRFFPVKFLVQPFVGFGFVAESYSFGGGPADRAQYLTRDIGVHFTTAIDRPWFLRATLIEQSFRRETYRGARLSLVRRL